MTCSRRCAATGSEPPVCSVLAEASRALIALGSNLGRRREHLQAAVGGVSRLPGTRVLATSRIFETQPVGGPGGQGAYLNAGVLVETRLTAPALLGALLGLEAGRGRERRERWGPRTLDLDLIAYDNLTCDAPGLTLPHPRAAGRAFVIGPLCDIAPEWVIEGQTLSARLQSLDQSELRVTRLRLD